jgi:hypothetical protein
VFSFSVSYQNHGPYDTTPVEEPPRVTCLDEQSNNIFNHYLRGLGKTITALTGMVEELEAMEEPVVLVLFGDHKPWAGNAESAYAAAGVSFDLSTEEGFYNYYSTPYLIWANSAAKETLGNRFVGKGEDISPCFLMAEVFDACGFEGSGFMQTQRYIRDITPLLHVQNLYWQNGLTDKLSTISNGTVDCYLWAEYFRETQGK